MFPSRISQMWERAMMSQLELLCELHMFDRQFILDHFGSVNRSSLLLLVLRNGFANSVPSPRDQTEFMFRYPRIGPRCSS